LLTIQDNCSNNKQSNPLNKEPFAAANELGFSNEYRFIEENGYNHPINKQQLHQLMYHTRNPDTIKQRYTYRDGALTDQSAYHTGVPGAAYLKELVIDYDPTINPKYNRNHICVTPQRLPPQDGILNSRPSCKRSLPITGYDTSDPYNLAATTVISREAELQRNLMEEKRDEPNYIPTDNLAYNLED
jgi:hypothetical protein